MAALFFVLDRHVAEMTEEPGTFGDAGERRMLQMRAGDVTSCERCLRPLPTGATILGWQRERHLSAAWRDHLSGPRPAA